MAFALPCGFARRTHALALVLVASIPAVRAQVPAPDPAASFQDRVQPIVFKNCNGCHTFGGHAGELRMDSFATLMKGGGRGPVVVPGHPESSLLLKAVQFGDPDLQMPPRGKLADSDIAAIEKWISELPADAASASARPAQEPVAVKTATPAAVPKTTNPEAPPIASPTEPPVVDVAALKITPEQEQFFEAKVRPLLAKNCYSCHTRSASGGLRLDSREAVLKGGKDGVVVVPGHPESSLLISALSYKAAIQMPPSGQLKTEEVAVVEQWIKDGVPWPKESVAAPARQVTEADRTFWAFHVPDRPAVPAVKSIWARNDIDRFILATLEEKHLKPVADADKRTLIRRVTYDLTGLPPTPLEVQSFLDDKSPKAYEQLIERLLASKAYGERWGRIWLDVVRYADTSGGGGDYPIAQAAKYRDYVIQSFVDDKPYDRFIREQLAGDLLPAQSEPEHWQNIIATGYLAGTNRYENKATYVSDAVDNLGSAFLGVTVGCARCHDHKFDPIPTADYYALYGILHSTKYAEPGDDAVRYQKDFTYRDPEALKREDWKIFQQQLKPIQGAIDAVLKLPGTYDDLLPQLEARRMHLFQHMPDLGESAYAVTEGTPEDAKIQHYGDPKNLGDQVRRGFLQVLGGSALPPGVKGSGRLELANWIASKDNPLTSRVMVNRIWQGHFGRGIVATPNDFGSRGMAPSNQALLDYLAWKLIDSGWSIKAIQREILLSHAYQLSAADSSANEEIDPENAFVWRHSRTRLDAEAIRDSLLADAQLLDRTPGGTHPFPPQAEWNWEDQNHFSPDMSQYETDRRTVYMMIQRSVRLTYFTLFDGPNTNVSTEQRGSSLTPLQALYFMNGDLPKRCATSLVEHLPSGPAADKADIEQAFLILYGRPPTAPEIERSSSFLRTAADAYATHGSAAADARKKALDEFVRALFATNEFMFVD
jgi:mono/diheme cytochrome c family protein